LHLPHFIISLLAPPMLHKAISCQNGHLVDCPLHPPPLTPHQIQSKTSPSPPSPPHSQPIWRTKCSKQRYYPSRSSSCRRSRPLWPRRSNCSSSSLYSGKHMQNHPNLHTMTPASHKCMCMYCTLAAAWQAIMPRAVVCWHWQQQQSGHIRQQGCHADWEGQCQLWHHPRHYLPEVW
jgi:hypothetical protein